VSSKQEVKIHLVMKSYQCQCVPHEISRNKIILVLAAAVVAVINLPLSRAVQFEEEVQESDNGYRTLRRTVRFINKEVDLRMKPFTSYAKYANFSWPNKIHWPRLHRVVRQMHLLCKIEAVTARLLV